MLLTNERTFSRKWKEIFIRKIERTFTKDEILKLYVSNIYYGEGAWGIEKQQTFTSVKGEPINVG